MKESQGETRKVVVTQSKLDSNKAEKRMEVREKPGNMPNPVKGLTLSLYPMNKEH
jgi:hypothetical protein